MMTDIHAKLPGPVAVNVLGEADPIALADAKRGTTAKVVSHRHQWCALFRPTGELSCPSSYPMSLQPTCCWRRRCTACICELGAKMAPFAGYDMPLWYKSVSEEHQTVRNDARASLTWRTWASSTCGAAARSAFWISSPPTTSSASKSARSHYTYLLDVDGIPLDDLMIYRLADEHFLAGRQRLQQRQELGLAQRCDRRRGHD